jgi:hypothetical protein
MSRLPHQPAQTIRNILKHPASNTHVANNLILAQHDVTLAAIPGAPQPTPPFPNPFHMANGVKLYRLHQAFSLAWHIDAAVIAAALATFAEHPTAPLLSVRLFEIQQSKRTIIASAQTALTHLENGYGYYPCHKEHGDYQAEIGLVTQSGGWLLVMRSQTIRLLPALPVTIATMSSALVDNKRQTTDDQHGHVFDDAATEFVQMAVTSDLTTAQQVHPAVTWAKEAEWTSGSGPAEPYPLPKDYQMLKGILYIEGQAAPGTWLDLGGHAYQVGAGGRFMLKIPVPTPQQLYQMLQLIPTLPVVARDVGIDH